MELMLNSQQNLICDKSLLALIHFELFDGVI
jgi:hypothetical protein